MARRGENIRKRKDGRWEGRFSKGKKDGKYIQGSVFGKTYQEAKTKLIQAKISQQESQKSTSEKQSMAMTELFSVASEEWLSASTPTLKESSIARYRNILDTYLLPEFSEKRVVDISRDDVATFSTKLLTSGGKRGDGLAPKTVSGIISVLKNVIDYIHHVKCVPTMDFDGLTVKLQQKQLRIFSILEQKILTDYLIENPTLVNLGVLICLYTGLRIGELCALKWGDISDVEKKIHVSRTMQRIQKPDDNGNKTQIIITAPKSNCSIRDIPIPDNVFQIIEPMKQPSSCFFLTSSEKNYIEPRCMENYFNRIMADCNIQHATMHTCRHTFATRCVELGFDIKSLSEILGHASVAITMNRYVHPSMELKKENMNKFSDMIRVKIRVNPENEDE